MANLTNQLIMGGEVKLVSLTILALIVSISAYSNEIVSLESKSETMDESTSRFSSSFSCRLTGSLYVAESCATGAGIRKSYTDCKYNNCETCAIESIETTDSAESGSFATAFVTVKIQGMNCK